MDEGAHRRAERMRRAEARRRSMPGEVVTAGTPKPELTLHLSPIERWRAMADLCRRQWLASGRPLPPPLPRDAWPGELYRLPWADD